MVSRTPPLTLVVTMTLNRRDVSCRWVPTLANQADCHWRHVVVDQGSTDGTADALERAGLEVVRSKTNLGVAGGWELGYRHAIATGPEPDIVCRVDDDCEPLADDVLARTVEFLTLTDGRYIASPINTTLSEESPFFPQVVSPRTTIAGFRVKVVSHSGLFVAVPHKAFRLMLDDGGICQGDLVRGRRWARLGFPSVYLTDLHIAHRGEGLQPAGGTYKF